jgi:hypothetical protein
MAKFKKKIGAQPDNQNAAKSALPTIKRVQDGLPVPLKTEALMDLAGEMVRPFFEDLGGEAAVSTGERLLLGMLKDLITVRLAILQDLITHGAVSTDRQTGARGLQPAVEKLSTFIGTESRIVRALGIRRKPRSISDLDSYLIQKQEMGEKEKETK